MKVRPWMIEAAVLIVVFAAAAWWGTRYWNASWKAGRQPIFYQEYFEAAVMMACGKGFVIANPQVPAMTEFLFRRSDVFSCGQIPADAHLGTQGMYQGVWRYLMTSVALAWRLLGISWSGMAPLFGLFFGASIATSYAVLRLGMGYALALLGAFGLSVSTLHLLNLPHLRDYSKAPFTLALILVLGLVVTVRPTRRAILGCAAAYGLIVGIGYGFRTDFLVNIPVFFFVLFAFVAGGLRANLGLKAAAAGICLAVFVAAAWPVLSVVYRAGGCQWHTALLGLTTPFTDNLQLEEAPYDWGHNYADGFIYKSTTSYARRVHPGIGHIEYCSHEYDIVTGQYLMEVARRFPADMYTRALASAEQIVNLPFPWFDAPLPELAPAIYKPRAGILKALKGSGPLWVGAALLLVSLHSARLALFGAFFLLYFGGYPAIQFSNRHHFHLELIAWWAFGFVVHQSVRAAAARLRAGAGTRPPGMALNWRQAAWVIPAIGAAVVAPLIALRVYQQTTVRGFLARYIAAPMEEVSIQPAAPGSLHRVARPPSADQETGESFLVVKLNTWRCGEKPSVTFRYDPAFPDDNYSRTFTVDGRSEMHEPTHVFTPVYRNFLGVEFSDVHPGCVDGVFRVRDLQSFTLLLPSVLTPRWERERLYQRMRRSSFGFGG